MFKRKTRQRVKMISDHPDFMKQQYVHEPTWHDKVLNYIVISCTIFTFIAWSVIFAYQLFAPEQAKMPNLWYD